MTTDKNKIKQQLEDIFHWWKKENLNDEDITLEEWLKDILKGNSIIYDDVRNLDYFLSELYPACNKSLCIWADNEVSHLQVTEYIGEKDYTIMYYNDHIPFKTLDELVNYIIKWNKLTK